MTYRLGGMLTPRGAGTGESVGTAAEAKGHGQKQRGGFDPHHRGCHSNSEETDMSVMIDVVVGGQFGSEAKGTVAARLLDRHGDSLRISVRVGGPNAGHTVIDHAGNVLRLRQVPVGVIFPDCLLGIAAGSEVDLVVLRSEIEMLEACGHQVRPRLYVDPSATLLEVRHHDAEAQVQLRDRIGSTAKGIGAARADRIMRNAATVERLYDFGEVDLFNTHSVAPLVRAAQYANFEGTQGYGLGLHTRFYPYATSGDCRAIDVLAQVGISPWDPKVGWVDPWVVFRPFPIRVAGNSGPLVGETSWDELGLPPEFTTVTKKMRRVGAWDTQLAYEAISENGGEVSAAITMADQTSPEEIDVITKELTDLGARVRMIGYGPELASYEWFAGGKR